MKTTVVQTLAMAAPSLRYIQDMDGGMWEIVYAGMTRYHKQEWQARCWFHMALVMYALTD